MLQKRGYNYLITERPDNPRDGVIVAEYTPGDKLVKFSASYGLLFNSPSLLQLAQRAFGLKTFKRLLVPEGEFLADPFRENVFFLDQASFDRDYDRHTEALRRVFTEAEVFVFTMGLNEYWRYKDDHTAISRNPRSTIVALLEHRRMTVAENVQAISKFHRIVKVHNPNFKMILSVSPIPFLASGLSQKLHVIQANSHSKAVLRVAAQELAETLEDVYYFPSFEMVMHTLADPWEEDMRHVKREAVSEIIELFYEMYQH
jgi:hypothetical protein